MGSTGRASKLFSKIPFSPRVSDPRPPGSLAAIASGTSAPANPLPLVSRMGVDSHLGSLLAAGAVTPQLPAPSSFSRLRRLVIGHGRSWPGIWGARVRAASAGSLWAVQRATPGGKFDFGSG